MHYVYILFSNKDKKFYTGSTKDLKRRIKEHNLGKVDSTKYRRPFSIALYECYAIKEDAIRRERFLKRSEGKDLLKKQLKDFLKKYKGSP
jgi:putative endonuclease